MDTSIYRKTPLVLPKLKTKAELIKALPSLKKYFHDSPSTPSPSSFSPSPSHAVRHQPNAIATWPSTTVDCDDDEEQELKRQIEDLKRAKKVRSELLQALSEVRARNNNNDNDNGSRSGSQDSTQTKEISSLRISLSEKQQMLNQLREKNAELEQRIEALSLESRDCILLLPEPGGGAAGEIANRLATTLTELEAAAKEADTRTMQYQLLSDRTARDRDTSEANMKASRALAAAADDDMHTLNQNFYELFASKEAAERELGAAVADFDDSKNEWQHRLRMKRREVKAVEKRAAEEAAAARAAAESASQKSAQVAREREERRRKESAAAAEANTPEVLEKLHAGEGVWVRLVALVEKENHARGAVTTFTNSNNNTTTPEDIVAAWKDLKERSQALQALLHITLGQEKDLLAKSKQLSATTEHIDGVGIAEDQSMRQRDANDNKIRGDEEEDEFSRLCTIAAAAEQTLSTLQRKLSTGTHSNKTTRSATTGLTNQRRRSSVTAAAAPALGNSTNRTHNQRRRSSIAGVGCRRMSAVEVTNARSEQGRRGSIAIPVSPPAYEEGKEEEENLEKQQQNSAPSVFPELHTVLADVVGEVETILLTASSPSSSTTMTTAISNIQPKTQHNDTETTTTTAGHHHQAEAAAERHIRRLAGTCIEPPPERIDAFALALTEDGDTDDDDGNGIIGGENTSPSLSKRHQRRVLDRAAIKHRSHKIVTAPSKQHHVVKSSPKLHSTFLRSI